MYNGRDAATRVAAAGDVRYRKFSATDRDSAVFEIMLNEQPIIDVARSDGNDLTSQFEVAFHPAVVGLQIPVDVLYEIVQVGVQLVMADEA